LTPCKICGAEAERHGVVDLNKSCEAGRGRYFPLAEVPVWYSRCRECGFLFTEHFDHWPLHRWQRDIYNSDYGQFDPDGADGSRARGNLPLVMDMIQRMGGKMRVLDYGGGDGTLADLLMASGVEAMCYDPMRHPKPVEFPTYGLITAFEVLEHTPTPVETAREILSYLREDGAVLFSTLTLDDLPPRATDHWYIAPRNGHISIHTRNSLDRLFAALNFRVQHLSAGLHLATRA
jgi:SAM-dependent methyltransferase